MVSDKFCEHKLAEALSGVYHPLLPRSRAGGVSLRPALPALGRRHPPRNAFSLCRPNGILWPQSLQFVDSKQKNFVYLKNFSIETETI